MNQFAKNRMENFGQEYLDRNKRTTQRGSQIFWSEELKQTFSFDFQLKFLNLYNNGVPHVKLSELQSLLTEQSLTFGSASQHSLMSFENLPGQVLGIVNL